MKTVLNGSDWTLQGWLPSSHRFNAESGINFYVSALTAEFPANVPGSVHHDLWDAGLIEDPYFSLNALKCEWVENKGWLYKKKFTLDDQWSDKKLNLVFDGIVYESRIYLNGNLLGVHKNMFTPAVFDVSGLIRSGENLLEVHLEPIPYGITQMGETSETKEMIARYFYSWDFCTRLSGVGLWKDVYVETFEDVLVEDVCVTTDYREAIGYIEIEGLITGDRSDVEICAAVSFGGQVVSSECFQADQPVFAHTLEIASPELWWPLGYGAQPLYSVSLEARRGSEILYHEDWTVGIRSIRYASNEGSSADALPYTVVVNGRKIWLRGMNFLPIDHMAGSVTDKQYDYYFELMRRQNVNLIRIWGGGYPEKQYVYDLCDRYGILVWQEFPQSNSGIDGIPSEIPEFLDVLKETAIHILKSLRSHTSIAIWCGGNELKDMKRNPADLKSNNLSMLSRLVLEYGKEIIFHPSSPSGPSFGMNRTESDAGNCHNVHGDWAYLGIENHYIKYNECGNLYHAEFGTGGCADYFSMQEFMPQKDLDNYLDVSEVWLFHGYAWWNSIFREADIFGEAIKNGLRNLISASQLIQAEGVRYIIESNRRNAFKNSGCNVWQMGEPFPNASCSSLVAYSGRPKMAYYTTRDCYEKTHASLKYGKLYYVPGEEMDAEVYLNHSGDACETTVHVDVLDVSGNRPYHLEEKAYTDDRESRKVCSFHPIIAHDWGSLFFVRLQVWQDDSIILENIYFFGTVKDTPLKPLFAIRHCSLAATRNDNPEGSVLTLTNTGSEVAAFVAVVSPDNAQVIYSDNFVTLFPSESAKITCFFEGAASFEIRDFAGQKTIIL